MILHRVILILILLRIKLFTLSVYYSILSQEYLGQETVTIGIGNSRAVCTVYPARRASERSVLSNPLTQSDTENNINNNKPTPKPILESENDKSTSCRESIGFSGSLDGKPLFDRSVVFPVDQRAS